MRKIQLAAIAAMTLLAGAVHAETPARPTIVLVHGAFTDASSWDRVVPLLQARGHKVIVLHQPMTCLADDVAAARRTISAQPGNVVLVGHSYGGLVITEAGNDTKVSALVYVAAFAPDAGESISDLGKGQPEPEWYDTLEVEEGYGKLPLAAVRRYFAQGIPIAQAKQLTAKQAAIPVASFETKVSTASWNETRTWYVRAEQDRMIDPAAQAWMAERMGATTISVRSNHLPMIMSPEIVAKVILEAAEFTPDTERK